MIISKEEMKFVAVLSAGQRQQVEEIERYINQYLMERYGPTKAYVLVPIDRNLDDDVRKVIEIRCREQGWTISFEPSPHHKDSYSIKLK